VHWGSEQQEELKYQVTYHTYLANRGGNAYTHQALNLQLVEECEKLHFSF